MKDQGMDGGKASKGKCICTNIVACLESFFRHKGEVYSPACTIMEMYIYESSLHGANV
jgi:hypothetical protein